MSSDQAKPARNYTHIAIAVVLFCLAAMAYALGAPYVASLMAIGLVIEIAAWVFNASRHRGRPLT